MVRTGHTTRDTSRSLALHQRRRPRTRRGETNKDSGSPKKLKRLRSFTHKGFWSRRTSETWMPTEATWERACWGGKVTRDDFARTDGRGSCGGAQAPWDRRVTSENDFTQWRTFLIDVRMAGWVTDTLYKLLPCLKQYSKKHHFKLYPTVLGEVQTPGVGRNDVLVTVYTMTRHRSTYRRHGVVESVSVFGLRLRVDGSF